MQSDKAGIQVLSNGALGESIHQSRIYIIKKTSTNQYWVTVALQLGLTKVMASKVATLKQRNSLSAIFPYVHFYLTTGQEHWHGSVGWHSSIRSPSTFECHY